MYSATPIAYSARYRAICLGVELGNSLPSSAFRRRGVEWVDVPPGLLLANHVLLDVAALRGAVGLVWAPELDSSVPVDAEPLQRLKKLMVAFLAVPRRVRVLDAEN